MVLDRLLRGGNEWTAEQAARNGQRFRNEWMAQKTGRIAAYWSLRRWICRCAVGGKKERKETMPYRRVCTAGNKVCWRCGNKMDVLSRPGTLPCQGSVVLVDQR